MECVCAKILVLCLCLLWHTIQTWFGDGSNFSLMAPKSYRGIVATPSHHHRITLNMFLHVPWIKKLSLKFVTAAFFQ